MTYQLDRVAAQFQHAEAKKPVNVVFYQYC